MTRTRWFLSGLAALMLMLTPGATAVAAPPSQTPPEPSVWMKQKLAATHNILDALTKADYPAVQLNANAMLAVGYLEKWVRADAPGYREMLGDFQYANKALVLASKEKNLDGATVAYVQLTISCVNCHKIVRRLGP